MKVTIVARVKNRIRYKDIEIDDKFQKMHDFDTEEEYDMLCDELLTIVDKAIGQPHQLLWVDDDSIEGRLIQRAKAL